MADTKQPDIAHLLRDVANEIRESATYPPLHTWEDGHAMDARAAHDEYLAAAEAVEALIAENETLHAENETLRTGLDAARLEIASLHTQMEAVGAGGMEPLRKRCLHQISEPAQAVGADQANAQTMKAVVHDAVMAASIRFISRLTGMVPPPLECAPPEVTAPFKQFADDVIAAIGATAPQSAAQALDARWVSAKDRLPDPFCEVLIHPRPTDYCCEGSVNTQGEWSYGEYEHHFGHNSIKCNVTHWMPLPTPPVAIAAKQGATP